MSLPEAASAAGINVTNVSCEHKEIKLPFPCETVSSPNVNIYEL